jgi:hypothetical protein
MDGSRVGAYGDFRGLASWQKLVFPVKPVWSSRHFHSFQVSSEDDPGVDYHQLSRPSQLKCDVGPLGGLCMLSKLFVLYNNLVYARIYIKTYMQYVGF